MSIIVKAGKFEPASVNMDFVALDEAATGKGIDLPNDIDPPEHMDVLLSAPAIRIDFPSSADGRGLSIASALRRAGYRGHLRAKGHVLADQYPLALRSGFDDVEISDDLADRQPEQQWADALTRSQGGYRERLMRRANRQMREAA